MAFLPRFVDVEAGAPVSQLVLFATVFPCLALVTDTSGAK